MRKLLVAAVVAGAVLAPTSAAAAPGDPAPGFGTNGVVTGGLLDTFGPLAVDSQGRIVVLGVRSGAIAIARYLADGQPDVSFSGDGRADLAIPVATFELVDVRALADDSVVAVGRRTTEPGNPFSNGLWAAKVTSTGTGFTGYGTNGIATEDQFFTAFGEVGSIAPDGSAMILQRGIGGGFATAVSATGAFGDVDSLSVQPPAGCVQAGPAIPVGATAISASEFAWVGEVAFGCDDLVEAVALTRSTSPAGAAAWSAIVMPPEAVEPDAGLANGVALAEVGTDLILATTAGSTQYVRRYSSAGQPVSGWGTAGRAQLNAGFGAIGDFAALPGGRVAVVNASLLAGSPSSVLVDVLLADGSPDPAFPRISVPVGGPLESTSIAAAPNGDILVTTQRAGEGTLRRFAGPALTGPPIRGGGPVAAGGHVCFDVAGAPGDVALVNLTPVLASGAGNGQLIASGLTPPEASNVNFRAGSVDPNVAAAPIGADGKVCYVSSAHSSVHIVADHLGTVSKSAITLATPTGEPARKVDTRIGRGGGIVGPNGLLCFEVAGSPGDVALVNLTPVLATGAGNGQLIASGLTPPEASNVNFAVGTVDPNVAIAPIGADGKVCYANSRHSSVHIVADHLGTIAKDAVTLATPTGAPSRRVDTRPV